MKCPYCEAPLSLPKYRKNKTIYSVTTCCNKSVRFIPTTEFRVAKDNGGQGFKSSVASRSLRRTNLIKRLVKETVDSTAGFRFVSCIARPLHHPDGYAGFKIDGVIEYLIIVKLPDSANLPEMADKLNDVLKAHTVETLSIEWFEEGRHQFKIHVSKIVGEEQAE
jgi:hypothetical protein